MGKNYIKKQYDKICLFFLIVILSLLIFVNFPSFAQNSIDNISSKFIQLSKQLADLEKFVYNTEKKDKKSSLSTGQLKRLDVLEKTVKELRGIIEIDISELKRNISNLNDKINNFPDSLNNSIDVNSSDFSKLNEQIVYLNDKIRVVDSRINTTVDFLGKSEVRIMRIEALINATIKSNDNFNTTFSQLELNNNSDGLPQASQLNEIGKVEIDDNIENETLGLLSLGDNNSEIVMQEIDKNLIKQYLPEGTPEEQFKFALELALKRKYDEAELALGEFIEINANHEKVQDAEYWYGGVLFKQQKYEESAFSDIDFNNKYPDDPRAVETTLRIAQAMSYVAQPSQACAVFEASLASVVDPPERFVRKINELKADKACD